MDEMEKAERNSGGAVLAGKEVEMNSGGRPFPLSMVVGQDNIKQVRTLSSSARRTVRIPPLTRRYSKGSPLLRRKPEHGWSRNLRW